MIRQTILQLCAVGALALAGQAAADPLTVHGREVVYSIDPATLRIDAQDFRTNAYVAPDGTIAVMPALHAPEAVTPVADKAGWHWTDAEGRAVTVSGDNDTLKVTITATTGNLSWALPQTTDGTWVIPDGEGVAFAATDPFWRGIYGKHDPKHDHCLAGTAALSFPAWSYMAGRHAVTYALDDGLKSALCLHDQDGVQGRLSHDFADGTQTLSLTFDVGAGDPLAPALFYRERIKRHGQLKTLADKAVPKLARLYGAPQAYVWGDGRDLGFLDDLKALGIQRILLAYDQDPVTQKHLIGPDYMRRADRMGYLVGPYEAFDNAQPAATADEPASIWDDSLYPSGCIHDAAGKVQAGFGNRGCELSSAATAAHPQAPSPLTRYAAHVKDGATTVFVDVDGFGEFYDDHSPDHPMTVAQDRVNRLTRLGAGITQDHLVIGSENVTAWSAPVTHYSHGTAQAHAAAVWPLLRDEKRFGGWWPPERTPLFFKPFTPTPDEARALFGPSDRLPLFEAVFHDSVIAADRWEFGLMKVVGLERERFAHALLYGNPTMWNLDRQELKRVGPWLKAAQDDFRVAHGWGRPVPLTGFEWLSDDHLVQQTRFAGGRTITANFGAAAWQRLGPDCVRVKWPGRKAVDLCPPADLPPA